MYSSLVNAVRNSPNCSSRYGEKISRITIHHAAGVCSIDGLLALFADPGRRASANYVIGNDGLIGGCVPEELRAWTSGSEYNDTRAITIEVSNNVSGEPWSVSSAAWESMIKLCVDICRRHNIRLWTDKVSESGTLTAHRWFQPTACPGPYLYDRFEKICEEVNAMVEGIDEIERLKQRVSELELTVAQICDTLDRAVGQIYDAVDDVPACYRRAVDKLVKDGALRGTGDGKLSLPEIAARIFTVFDREGVIDK